MREGGREGGAEGRKERGRKEERREGNYLKLKALIQLVLAFNPCPIKK